MKIAVVCANGKVGKLVVKEASDRGHEVTAVVRGENKSAAKKSIIRDIFEITPEDLKGFDVVVDAFGAFTPETLPLHSKSLKHLCDVLSGSDSLLLVVGGAGSLYTDKSHTTQLFDTPDFPKEYVPLAKAQGKALAELRERKDVKWTFVSPAAVFLPDGERTGKYILGGEEFTLNEKGESVISYADYAIAMVDEAEKKNHIRERISVNGI